jgi:hypothetical protein
MLISTLKLAPGLRSLHGVDKTAPTTLPQFAIYRPKLSCFSFELYYVAKFRVVVCKIRFTCLICEIVLFSLLRYFV